MNRSAKLITWKDARQRISNVYKEFADTIDKDSPNDDYKLLEVDYIYGDLFVKNGTARIPNKDGKLITINQSENKKILKDFSYSDMPLFIIVENDSELFIDQNKKITPLNLISPKGNNYCKSGIINGTYEAMDYIIGRQLKYDWTFSSGARSIITLPKISDAKGLKKIYNEYATDPTLIINTMQDHWLLFKSIAQSPTLKQKWKNKIIFFSKKWLDNKNTQFRDFLIKTAWEQIHYLTSITRFNFSWNKYFEILSTMGFKPSPYIISQLKHIFSIINSDYQAFTPDNSQQSAPINEIQKALINTYELREYYPTIMTTSKASLHQPIYYSLQISSALEGTATKSNVTTFIVDIKEIKTAIENIKRNIENEKNTIHETLNKTQLDFIRVEKDRHQELLLSSELPKNDPRFTIPKTHKNRKFCHNSQFFRGCVKITQSK